MSPFNEARYRALLEGLEASEVPLSHLDRTMRIDAEYFFPKHLMVARQLASMRTEAVPQIAGISDGNHFSVSGDFVDEGIPYYRGQDAAGHFFIEQAAPKFITEAAFKRPYMTRSHLKKGDVLLSIVGTIGEASLVSEDTPATCSCKLAILRPHRISAEYLATFLRTKHGHSQIQRNTRGAVQMGLLLEDLSQIHVPRFSAKFESAIASAIAHVKTAVLETESASDAASAVLLNKLRLSGRQAPEPLSYTRNSRDAFSAGRLDAEFHQPKYQAALEAVTSRFKVAKLAELGSVMKGITVPYTPNGTLPIIRSGDLSDLDDDSRFLRATPDETIFELERGDVLISSIGFGSIGKVQVFDKPGRYGTVSEVTVIRQKKLNPYYLAAFFRSHLGQMQIERYITGATGQLHLYSKSVAKFWVPLIPERAQLEFERQAKSAADARTHAADLLEAAKRAVEIAIEQSEAAALAYLAKVNP